MKSLKVVSLLIIINLLCLNLYCQLGVGEWRSHLTDTETKIIRGDDKYVYCANNNSIMVYSISENQLIKNISKLNLLSDIDISTINYNAENNLLSIGYNNGLVEFYQNDNVYTITDIKLTGSYSNKKINSIFVLNKKAYLATNFGIVVINIDKLEIADTYIIGDNATEITVTDLIYNNNRFYASTENGIYQSDEIIYNLSDFKHWNRININPKEKKFTNLILFNNAIIASYYDELASKYKVVSFTNTTSEIVGNLDDVTSLKSYDNKLYIATGKNLLIYNTNYNLIEEIKNYNEIESHINDVFYVEEKLFLADQDYGLLLKENNQFTFLSNEKPLTNNVSDISIEKGKVAIVPGINKFSKPEFYIFENQKWTNYSNNFFSDLYASFALDLVKINPSNTQHLFCIDKDKGIIEIKDNKIVNYHTLPNGSNVNIGDACFDSQNNLWVVFNYTPNCLGVLNTNKDAAFKYYSINALAGLTNKRELIIGENDYKWILSDDGISVFIEDSYSEESNQYNYVNFYPETSEGNTITQTLYTIELDLNNSLWIGSDKGLLLSSNTNDVFTTQKLIADRVYIEENNSLHYILDEDIITCIKTDGANRKLIGSTYGGLFILSNNADKIEQNFKFDNSNIISNTIKNIEIDHISGEVFIATNKGLVSYRGKATKGAENFDKIYVYPNPIKENYFGDITIANVMENSNIKITDISGNLVFETISKGGQATWDGKNFRGQRVKTGVYLVFCSNSDNSQTTVTKLLFIN